MSWAAALTSATTLLDGECIKKELHGSTMHRGGVEPRVRPCSLQLCRLQTGCGFPETPPTLIPFFSPSRTPNSVLNKENILLVVDCGIPTDAPFPFQFFDLVRVISGMLYKKGTPATGDYKKVLGHKQQIFGRLDKNSYRPT
ncbi:hypothetical protein B0H11DRAFT_1914418 [Mycena galericulata]|nr:hypothetical protein B0H11DRAFT_1914418 [Mycena galericulata]